MISPFPRAVALATASLVVAASALSCSSSGSASSGGGPDGGDDGADGTAVSEGSGAEAGPTSDATSDALADATLDAVGDGTAQADGSSDAASDSAADALDAGAGEATADAAVDSPPEAASCLSGQALCDGGCVSTTSDDLNCGACGLTCSGGATCIDAGCVTPRTSEGGANCDPTARAGFPVITTPAGVYLVEGIPVNAPTPLSTTALVGISDGGIDPSQCAPTSNATVPVAEYGMGVARVASSVYLLAGADSTGSRSACYRAGLVDGGLSAFAGATVQDGGAAVTLQTSRYDHAVLQRGSYVYVVGGWNGLDVSPPGTDLASVERAQVDPVTGDFLTSFTTAIDPATTQPAALALPRFGMEVFVSGSWVYAMGGQTGIGSYSVIHGEIQRAQFDANGNLSTFTQVGSLPTALTGAAVFSAGGTVYLLGGATGYSNPNYTLTNGVLSAPILADGTLGAFDATSLSLPYAQCCGGVSSVGRTVYLLEGLTGSGFTATTGMESLTIP